MPFFVCKVLASPSTLTQYKDYKAVRLCPPDVKCDRCAVKNSRSVEYDGHPQPMDKSEIELIGGAMEEQKAVILKKHEDWLGQKKEAVKELAVPKEEEPKATVQGTDQSKARSVPPKCIECGTVCVEKPSLSGGVYYRCPKCQMNRRRDGTAFPDQQKKEAPK